MPEVRLPSPVEAKYLPDWPDDPPAGAYCFSVDACGTKSGFIYCCPCGCGQQGCLGLRPLYAGNKSWDWDGNIDRPTLNPSVHHVGHWHGWLRAGKWEQA